MKIDWEDQFLCTPLLRIDVVQEIILLDRRIELKKDIIGTEYFIWTRTSYSSYRFRLEKSFCK